MDGVSFSEDHYMTMVSVMPVSSDDYAARTPNYARLYPEQAYWYGDGICLDVAMANLDVAMANGYLRRTLFRKFTPTNAFDTMMTSNFLVFSNRNVRKLVFKHVDSATPQE